MTKNCEFTIDIAGRHQAEAAGLSASVVPQRLLKNAARLARESSSRIGRAAAESSDAPQLVHLVALDLYELYELASADLPQERYVVYGLVPDSDKIDALTHIQKEPKRDVILELEPTTSDRSALFERSDLVN